MWERLLYNNWSFMCINSTFRKSKISEMALKFLELILFSLMLLLFLHNNLPIFFIWLVASDNKVFLRTHRELDLQNTRKKLTRDHKRIKNIYWKCNIRVMTSCFNEFKIDAILSLSTREWSTYLCHEYAKQCGEIQSSCI